MPGIDTELPYTVSRDNDELERHILEFDESRYIEQMNRFVKDVELIFDGKASCRVADKIESFIKQ